MTYVGQQGEPGVAVVVDPFARCHMLRPQIGQRHPRRDIPVAVEENADVK